MKATMYPCFKMEFTMLLFAPSFEVYHTVVVCMTKGAFHQSRSNLIWITIRGQPIWSTNFCFTNADQIKIAVDLGSDLIAGQSEVKLVDPSFRLSVHVLFSGCGYQKSQSCRLGQLETLYKLASSNFSKGFWRSRRCHGRSYLARYNRSNYSSDSLLSISNFIKH